MDQNSNATQTQRFTWGYNMFCRSPLSLNIRGCYQLLSSLRDEINQDMCVEYINQIKIKGASAVKIMFPDHLCTRHVICKIYPQPLFVIFNLLYKVNINMELIAMQKILTECVWNWYFLWHWRLFFFIFYHFEHGQEIENLYSLLIVSWCPFKLR
jgi:hypothetical protein